MRNRSTSRRLSALLPLALLLGATHCSGSVLGQPASSDGGGLPPALGAPQNHRPSAPGCPSTRPPGINEDAAAPDSGIAGTCTQDSDCSQGKNGRCLPPEHNVAGNYCSYDACEIDSDCGNGSLCECGATGGADGRAGNTCLPSNCRLDSDCGADGYCSPTYDTTCGSYGGTIGYYCHTTKDTCTNDSDCAEGGPDGYCAWQPTEAKWACSYGVCAG